MPDNLREFVYLDDISVNSHLSSLGEGKPQEIVDVSEDETENSGGGNIEVIKGSRTSRSLNSTETQMSATAPYRFERLLEKLEEEEIPIHDNPDPREVARGDVVRISGKFTPMSLYKIEIAIKALFNLIDEETAQSVTEANLTDEEEESEIPDPDDIPGSRENPDDSTDAEALSALYQVGDIFRDLAEELIGESVPIRIQCQDTSAVTLLDRGKFEVPHRDAFFEEKDYVLFGRVDERISRNEEWDPIRASNIMGRYFEDQESTDWQDDWEETAEGIGIQMEDEDLLISGRSIVIHPIAVYW
ncbi:DUF6414 family protein [Halorussus amylolyticus]|uniref:DUF6414 family protein n=1 Tax=Halorussus amylolyticus TaxID=1126242 RepID=UPI001043F54F|nr:hypothetical protein [Halorussus amylolyticus]